MAFLGLIRAWIAWYRHGLAVDGLDVLVPDGDISWGGSTAADVLFVGGRSGGAGAGASFQLGSSQVVAGVRAPVSPPSGPAGGLSLGDLVGGDDAWPIAVALLFAAGGWLVAAYVIYAAPVLLAKVALGAAVMGGLYRRLRRDDARHWSRGVVRSTWLPALLIVVCAVGVGYFAQFAVPEATSIGRVLEGLTTPER